MGGEVAYESVLSPLVHPTPRNAGLTPPFDRLSFARFLAGGSPSGRLRVRIASMRNLFSAIVVATIVLLPASFADAADCSCDRASSIESCAETVGAQIEAQDQPMLPPMWCERGDDPRCMPASTHGGAFHTLTPVAMGWDQQHRWTAPLSAASRFAISVDGGSRQAHARRVDRPPR